MRSSNGTDKTIKFIWSPPTIITSDSVLLDSLSGVVSSVPPDESDSVLDYRVCVYPTRAGTKPSVPPSHRVLSLRLYGGCTETEGPGSSVGSLTVQ